MLNIFLKKLFIEFMLKGKTLTDFTNVFSPNDFKKMMNNFKTF